MLDQSSARIDESILTQADWGLVWKLHHESNDYDAYGMILELDNDAEYNNLMLIKKDDHLLAYIVSYYHHGEDPHGVFEFTSLLTGAIFIGSQSQSEDNSSDRISTTCRTIWVELGTTSYTEELEDGMTAVVIEDRRYDAVEVCSGGGDGSNEDFMDGIPNEPGGGGAPAKEADLPVVKPGCGADFILDENGDCVPLINEEEIELVAGDRPIKEYPDKCAGIQDMWNSYTDQEAAGYLTADGKIILTNINPLAGGDLFGIYSWNGIAYYPYPKSDAAPNQNYTGMIEIDRPAPGYYLIPVTASIHTHTLCRSDGSNGVSHPVGEDDLDLATRYPSINHWAVGCNAIGQFNASSADFFNVSTGGLSRICNKIE